MTCQRLEDLVAIPHRSWLGRPVALGARPETECSNESFDAGADGRIADPELALHVAQVPPRAQEAFQQCQLFARQPAEAADAELPLEGCPAAPTVEAGDRQLVRTDR